MSNYIILLSIILFQYAIGNIVLYPYQVKDGTAGNAIDAVQGFGNTTAISSTCATALNQSIACDERIQMLAAAGFYGSLNSTGAAATLCSPACNTSLVNYHTSVSTACSGVNAFDSLPSSWRGDLMLSFFNLVCSKDPGSGQFCPG